MMHFRRNKIPMKAGKRSSMEDGIGTTEAERSYPPRSYPPDAFFKSFPRGFSQAPPSHLNSCLSTTEFPFQRTKSSSNTAVGGPEKYVVSKALLARGPVNREYPELGSTLVQPLDAPGTGEIDVAASNVTPSEAPGMMKNSIFVKRPTASGR